MLEAGLPVGVGMQDVELVVAAEVLVGMGLLELAAGEGGGGHHHVGAGLVEGHGVEGGGHAEVGHDGGVVVVPAVG